MAGLTSRDVHMNKVKGKYLIGLMVVQCAKKWMPMATGTNKSFGGNFGVVRGQFWDPKRSPRVPMSGGLS